MEIKLRFRKKKKKKKSRRQSFGPLCSRRDVRQRGRMGSTFKAAGWIKDPMLYKLVFATLWDL